MRCILLAICLLGASLVHGQFVNLQGKYTARIWGPETIEFVGRDSFYFRGANCIGWMHGRGRCEIKNDRLYLYFADALGPEGNGIKGMEPVVTRLDRTGGRPTVHVQCVDDSGAPLEAVSLTICGRKWGVITDSMGRASFAIDRDSVPLRFLAFQVGYEGMTVCLDEHADYNVKISMPMSSQVDKSINDGRSYVYEIDELSEDRISLRTEGSAGAFSVYWKIY